VPSFIKFIDTDVIINEDVWTDLAFGLSADGVIYMGINFRQYLGANLSTHPSPPTGDDFCSNLTAINTTFGYYLVISCNNPTISTKTRYFLDLDVNWTNLTNTNVTLMDYYQNESAVNPEQFNTEALVTSGSESDYIIEYFSSSESYLVNTFEFVFNSSSQFEFRLVHTLTLGVQDSFKDLSVTKDGIFILTINNKIKSYALNKKQLEERGTYTIPQTSFSGVASKI
jgi:hypothetical protein